VGEVQSLSISIVLQAQTTVIGFTIQNGSDGIRPRAKTLILNNHFTGNNDAIDYEGSGGGVCRDNVFRNNRDDAIDLDGSIDVLIEGNLIHNNGDDGIEIRLHSYRGPTLKIIVRDNLIAGNGEDGIQLIDYSGLSDREFLIERNQFTANDMVGLGLMDKGQTKEDFRAASIPERIYLFNNTFSGNSYAVTGGDNLIALNNLFVNTSKIALKKVDGGPTGSIAAYNLFWNNGADHLDSNIDASTSLYSDPLLNIIYQLQDGSPAIDSGTASFNWNGEAVLDISQTEFTGAAPDLGNFEYGLHPTASIIFLPLLIN
jgi:parallel beta-helix repeat protein